MNNRNGIFKSILPVAATGVAILGLVRGIRSRSFKPFLQTILSSLSSAAPIAQAMMGGNVGQKTALPLQEMMNNQDSQQQPADPKNSIR